MIRPKKLIRGDKICVISPSSNIVCFPRRLKRSLNALSNLGFEIVFSKYATEITCPKNRASDLMNAFIDPSIKCVIASTGGYTSNTLLEHLDFDVILNNPKIFVGFSDITALLLAIYEKTKIITFHGPSLLPSFGDYCGVHVKTASYFLKALASDKNIGRLDDFDIFSDDSLIWEKEDNVGRRYIQSDGLVCLSGGFEKGYLCGGNLETIVSIVGTEYCPSFSGSILFLEECGGRLEKTFRDLTTLSYHGVFSRIKGLVFARPYQYKDKEYLESLTDYLRHIGSENKIPVLYNFPVGHTEPKFTLPIGCNAEMCADRGYVDIVDAAVI